VIRFLWFYFFNVQFLLEGCLKKLVYLLFILINTVVYSQVKYELIKSDLICTINNEIVKIDVSGNCVLDQFYTKNFCYIEVHINPSLSELIKISIKDRSFNKYYVTLYRINKKDDVLILLNGPHFSAGRNTQKIFVNDNAIENVALIIDSVMVNDLDFDLYSKGRKVSIVRNNGVKWVSLILE